MASSSSSSSGAGEDQTVRVVVIGDEGVGKTSLIVAAATDSFPDNPPPVLPYTRLSAETMTERMPLLVVDTSSRREDQAQLEQELQLADAVIVCYAIDRPETLVRIGTHWMLELRRLSITAPVILVACKHDLTPDPQGSLERTVGPVMDEWRQIDTTLACSARELRHTVEPFYYAQKAVLHPVAPLFDVQQSALHPACVKALKRIFTLCDRDHDEVLSDAELNEFQMICFDAPLQPDELDGVKRVVAEKMPSGAVTERGLALPGFLLLHALFIERGRIETTWQVLRKFGYNNELHLRPELVQSSLPRHSSDQVLELSSEANEFLKKAFEDFDRDRDGALNSSELEDVFSTAPCSPMEGQDWASVVETSAGALTFSGWLSYWAMTAILDPIITLTYFQYLCYTGDPSVLLRPVKRRVDKKRRARAREVIYCYVFGPAASGKSALLDGLIGRAFNEKPSSSGLERVVANQVRTEEDGQKTLVMREVPAGQAEDLASSADALAHCDVAAFLFDSSSMSSFDSTAALLSMVADSGAQVPCIVLATKDDLGTPPEPLQESQQFCASLMLPPPLSLSLRSGDTAEVYKQVAAVATEPQGSIAVSEASRALHERKHRLRVTAAYATGAVAVAAVGIIAFRIYSARRQSSS
eukprot:jgi/Chlat1/3002/Chrsp2S04718